MLRYSALVFSLASLLDMPPRTKKAEAATNIWRKRKEKVSPSNRPKKLKAWSNESMLLAITAVRDGTMSSNMASRTYNVPQFKKGKKPGPARVLTSQQSLEMLVEKGRKKQEEEAEKERKKREREEKRKLRVEMNMRKAEERKVRIEERKGKAEEKAQEQELKRLEREKKKELEFKCKQWEQKKNSGFSKTFITRSKTKDSCAPQNEDNASSECTVSVGEYQDDLSPDGVPMKTWVQCTNEECQKWMHEDCITRNSEDNLVCICGNASI